MNAFGDPQTCLSLLEKVLWGYSNGKQMIYNAKKPARRWWKSDIISQVNKLLSVCMNADYDY